MEFDIKRLIVCIEFSQLFNEVFDSLMLLEAFRHKLFSLLVCLLPEGWIEDVLFKLSVGLQFDKNLLFNLALGFLILGFFIVLEQVSDLLMIRFQHLNGILRSSGIMSTRRHGLYSFVGI
jgi:hypothetical protein